MNAEWNGFFVDHNFVEKLNEIKKDYDMKNKEKISDNPYEGGTLYAVLRDRIVEKKKLPLNTTIPNDEMVRELLHTRVTDLIPMLIHDELDRANTKFPPFASDMEGWAVLKEEIDEVSEELNAVKIAHDTIWAAIRANEEVDGSYITPLFRYSVHLIKESIQVAAMAMKYAAMLERNERKEE